MKIISDQNEIMREVLRSSKKSIKNKPVETTAIKVIKAVVKALKECITH